MAQDIMEALRKRKESLKNSTATVDEEGNPIEGRQEGEEGEEGEEGGSDAPPSPPPAPTPPPPPTGAGDGGSSALLERPDEAAADVPEPPPGASDAVSSRPRQPPHPLPPTHPSLSIAAVHQPLPCISLHPCPTAPAPLLLPHRSCRDLEIPADHTDDTYHTHRTHRTQRTHLTHIHTGPRDAQAHVRYR